MNLTRKQKQLIREHWWYMPIRFLADGTVMGKKGEAWGILYTPQQTQQHIEHIGEQQ